MSVCVCVCVCVQMERERRRKDTQASQTVASRTTEAAPRIGVSRAAPGPAAGAAGPRTARVLGDLPGGFAPRMYDTLPDVESLIDAAELEVRVLTHTHTHTHI